MGPKEALLGLARMSGAFAVFRAMNRRRILVLTYHRFSHTPRSGRTSAANLAAQLDYLASRYTVLPLSMIESRLREGRPLPRSTAAITIDDGYSDFYEIAWPLLCRRNLPATIFTVTDFVDANRWIWTDKIPFLLSRTREERVAINVAGLRIAGTLTGDSSRRQFASQLNSLLKHRPDESKDHLIDQIAAQCSVELPARPPGESGPCTWEQLREMESAGIEVGSHTVTHPVLTRVTGDRLYWELGESRRRLEEMLGHDVTLFCYPNGAYNRVVRDAVARAGYRVAVTSDDGLNDATIDPLALRRIHNEEQDLAHFLQSTSGFEEAKNALLRRPALQYESGSWPSPASRRSGHRRSLLSARSR
jgi:peptidoglycan/xylan/chitin deacetylase (PgdA/CDA1 family)